MKSNGGREDTSHCSHCEPYQLKALNGLELAIENYGVRANQAYSDKQDTAASAYKRRREALKLFREDILRELVDAGCVDRVETHEIYDHRYYYLYVENFGYHTLANAWEEPPLDAPDTPSKTFDSYSVDDEKRPESLSEEEALRCLTKKYQSPNNYIGYPFVMDSENQRFVGWTPLPGVVEEGDKVDERLRGIDDPKYMFEVGDTFKTEKGNCEILDRYFAWLSDPRIDALRKMEAYDIRLEGHIKKTVSRQRILKEWGIQAPDDVSDEESPTGPSNKI
jgi:hypothetical protein